MKHITLHLITLLILALTTLSATAHDFEVDGIYYNINGTEATVTSGTNEYASDVTIPKTVIFGGTTYSVTSIGDYAFYNCSGLTSITIPNSVTSIGNNAFEGCSSLTSITIPNSVTSIGDYAFYNCTGLSSITIPNSVTDIGDLAFSSCSGLTSVTIPNSVTHINYGAFCGCSGLTSINIPNSVTSIGQGAFDECYSLASITIPNSVTHIGGNAFHHTAWFDNQPDGLVYVGLVAYTYKGTKPAETSITIAEGTLGIADIAFWGCENLSSITIPNSVTSIGISAFYETAWFDNQPDGLVYAGLVAYGYKGTMPAGTNISIAEGTLGIAGGAFSDPGLTSIVIPSTVTSIGCEAFLNRGLTSVTCLAITPPNLSNTSGLFPFPSHVTNKATLYVPRESLSAYQAADNWKDFSEIVGIPIINDFEVDGVWYRALTDNKAIVIQNQSDESFYQGGIVIPDTVSSQGYTFAVTAIDASAFEDCYDLASVVIGDAVETIGENAFQGCTGLTSVTIGSGVRAIGAKAFNYCNALTTVTCRGTVPPVMANANCFSNAAYSRAKLLVPRQQIEAYKAADYWYRFSNIDGWGSAGMGDVNADGIIGISDVTALTNALLTNSTDPALLEYGDLNHNGRLDIGDVTNLIVSLLTH